MSESEIQLSRYARQLGRRLDSWLEEHTVEQHFSREAIAAQLDLSVRTIDKAIDQYTTSGGKEGLGPVVRISHKCARIPASAVRRWLESRTIRAAARRAEASA